MMGDPNIRREKIERHRNTEKPLVNVDMALLSTPESSMRGHPKNERDRKRKKFRGNP